MQPVERQRKAGPGGWGGWAQGLGACKAALGQLEVAVGETERAKTDPYVRGAGGKRGSPDKAVLGHAGTPGDACGTEGRPELRVTGL